MSALKLLTEDRHRNGIELIPGDRHWLENILKKLFPVYDPFKPVVSNYAPVRAVIFSTDSYHLTEPQFEALLATIESTNEQRFYISETEWEPDPFERGSHWLCYRPSFEDYTRLPTGLENAIYSIDGTWGILLSQELHGFLACDENFWSVFKSNYPGWKEDKIEFLKYWEEVKIKGVQTNWLPIFLRTLND